MNDYVLSSQLWDRNPVVSTQPKTLPNNQYSILWMYSLCAVITLCSPAGW